MAPSRNAQNDSVTSPLLGACGSQRHLSTSTSHSNILSIPTEAEGIDYQQPEISRKDSIFVLGGVFIIGWSYGLDGLMRNVYQSYAVSKFDAHSLISTINVLRSVIAAAAYPPAAKFADLFGRFELVAASVIFYITGTAVESIATSVGVFTVGAVLYQIGYTCIVLLAEVIIADVTTMRSRVIFSYVPAVPFVVNTWISGEVASIVIRITNWRWGIGMWCFIYAISATPLLVGLYRARLRGAIHDNPGRSRTTGIRAQIIDVSTHLDLIGLTLAVAALILILVPLTLAGGRLSAWGELHIIAPLTLGLGCIAAFVHWEDHHAHAPLLPRYLLKDRGVMAALVVRCLLNATWAIQGNYLYTVLVVAFDFSVTLSTQVTAFFTFFGVISGLLIGLVILKIRRLKLFIITGTLLFMVAFGLLVNFDSETPRISKHRMLSAQILMGLAAGFCAYPTQASVQAATRHQHVSAITGFYLASFNIGSALGTCISGAIWSETLLPTLVTELSFQSNSTLAHDMYKSPFEVISSYPVGTSVRSAVISSYGYVEMLLCVTGLCLCIPMVGGALMLHNPVLSSAQTQPRFEDDDPCSRYLESRGSS